MNVHFLSARFPSSEIKAPRPAVGAPRALGRVFPARRVRAIICALGLVIGACPTASAVTAPMAQSCAPKAKGAKILRTKSISDVDPNWAPPAAIGTSWSLSEVRREGRFLRGRLVNPRGGILPGRVFVIASEWDCG